MCNVINLVMFLFYIFYFMYDFQNMSSQNLHELLINRLFNGYVCGIKLIIFSIYSFKIKVPYINQTLMI